MPDTTTVVLVHGAWHGAWCWDKVVALLDANGVATTAFDLPLSSYDDDVKATAEVLNGVDGPVVLCGHSYGGAVITAAGHHPSVTHLVYLTAFACDEGESLIATATDEALPATDLGSALVVDEDQMVTVADAAKVDTFYHDCEPGDAADAIAHLRPTSMSCFTTSLGLPAWRTKPSTYIVCTEDRAIHPALQRHMATRCTTSVEWATAHSPFLNRPDLVADLLSEHAT